LRGTTQARTIKGVKAKTRVVVDFHLSPDGQHTFASIADMSPVVALAAGDIVEATDGELTRLAVVDFIDGSTLSLVVLWDASASIA
jgi:hypothetical protein